MAADEYAQECLDRGRTQMNHKSKRKEPTPDAIEYHNRVDHRKRAEERLLTAPHVDPNNFEELKVHGKVHQVQFKISPFAQKVGSEVSVLFGMSLSQYCKALLYLNLGLISEPIDRRRKRK
jgi:hypothetical protein